MLANPPQTSQVPKSKSAKDRRLLVVGAGFSGAVAARFLAENGGYSVLVIDSREHVAGNCHTFRDEKSDVMIHRYGPHIFHTDNEKVWSYVQRFAEFGPFVNRVKASISQGIFSLPINLHTINQFFGRKFSPNEARDFIGKQADQSIAEPRNFEEQALKLIGKDLYEAFFYGYTLKQWGCEPRELPVSVFSRLPVRFNYDDNYFRHRFQGIPCDGYSALVAGILDHEGIEVRLSTNYEPAMASEFSHVFYTGPLDGYFGHRLGRLSYRTVFWDRVEAEGDLQGNALMNYPGLEVPHTRIHEHKHFAPWEHHDSTVGFIEYSKETEAHDIPYYPKRLPGDIALYNRYLSLAAEEDNLSFLGRLATYRYLDMDQVIAEALQFAEEWLLSNRGN